MATRRQPIRTQPTQPNQSRISYLQNTTPTSRLQHPRNLPTPTAPVYMHARTHAPPTRNFAYYPMTMGNKKSRKADGERCRKHPRHRQAEGVCPFCLRHRLSHLSSSSSLPSVVRCGSSCPSSSASSASWYSSEGSTDAELSSAEAVSPVRPSLLMRHERVLADGDVRWEGRRARRNFWAKLLHGTWVGGKKEGCSLEHARTLDEKGAAKWPVLF